MAKRQPVPMPAPKDWVRFMGKVRIEDEDGCWIWIGLCFNNGYGLFTFAGSNRRAHRVLYCWLYGEPGKNLDHTCNRPACVKPSHLRPVTQKENVLKEDSKSLTAENSRKTHCLRGHTFDDANTSMVWNKRDRAYMRRCKTCARDAARDTYHRKKARSVS